MPRASSSPIAAAHLSSHHPQAYHHAQRHPPPPSSPHGSATPSSIPDDRLPLSSADIATLRQHQQLAHAQIRSPAGSSASSQGRLLLDSGSLQLLSAHFDRVMQAIGQRLDQLNRATEIATQQQYDQIGNAIDIADAEIARFRAILHQIDELEAEFEKIKRIRDIVRGYRARVEQIERRL